MSDILNEAARRAVLYREHLSTEPIRPEAGHDLGELTGPLPEEGTDPDQVIKLIDEVVTPATMGFSSPRFYGWVIGSVYPVALAADWLTSSWDQNTVFHEASPGTVALEATALRWIRGLAGLPETTWGAFVTGTTVGNATGLAAARTSVLAEVGWDVTSKGLFGAPEVTVVVGDEVHPSLVKALGFVGLGRDRVVRVPVDDQGRMRADAFPTINGPAIVCLQAGNVNTGAFDPMAEIIPIAKQAGAWVHVDAAFGFWAAVSPSLRHLAAGMELADSWATDCHKYLNVPYDAGIVMVRDPSWLERVMSVNAEYLLPGQIGQDPGFYTPELSRRARGVPTYAVLRHLGRAGVVDLIDRTVRLARLFARRLAEEGFEILNDVVLNQVLVSFGDAEETRRVVRAVAEEGVMFAGPTVWQGRTAMRISVSGYATTDDDIEESVRAILRAVG
ncbi:MAG TPA: aminotransferase class V-fold PLP-dependent enzyme [Acidimicrobiia bacterium]|nr:aminotransferase class V-fold PLP-dependent enzyme [Acidimicrobiia bacterium]